MGLSKKFMLRGNKKGKKEVQKIDSTYESEILTKEMPVVNEDNVENLPSSANDSTDNEHKETPLVDESNIPEYNILLLGETGAGKSTTINAIANYLKYSTFEEAKVDDFVNLIPSKFVLPDPKSGQPIEILSGTVDSNEQQTVAGRSATQAPKCYTFKLNDWMLRIIDTPGMGDTSGVDTDKANFEKILIHLHNYKRLHGICFLIKSCETRKTAYFQYCITELLTHLHRSASANIVFCFTFSRNSYFGPGEGYTTLKSFLDFELPAVNIKLEPGKNCFFIDNEAYRYLVAKKQGYPFETDIENSFLDSWKKSVEQTNRMWEKMKNMTPHELQSTCSLNNARKLILELAEPMVQLQNSIVANIEQIKCEEDRINNSTLDKQNLASSLMIQVDDLESRQLPYPTTVCTSSGCTDVVSFQGQLKINYKTRCHENCQLDKVQTNIVGHEILQKCCAINPSTLSCHECECPWQKHMHITCEYIKVKRTIMDANLEQQIKSKEDAIHRIEETLQLLRTLVEEYQHEYNVIQDVSSKFAYILNSNSLTPYNQFIEPYLNLLISQEEKKLSLPGYPRTGYESLVKMKATHRQCVQILAQAIQNKTAEDVCLEDIEQYREQLFGLKNTGPQFRQMMKVADELRQKIAEQVINEQKHDFSNMLRWVKNKVATLFLGSRSKKRNSVQQQQRICNLCEQEGHWSIQCREGNAGYRAYIARDKQLCPVCLIPGHGLIGCKSKYTCARCRGKHSVTICAKGAGQVQLSLPWRS